ncbi:hypothetical protein AUP68_11591 [Ilyonectria robusta]
MAATNKDAIWRARDCYVLWAVRTSSQLTLSPTRRCIAMNAVFQVYTCQPTAVGVNEASSMMQTTPHVTGTL